MARKKPPKTALANRKATPAVRTDLLGDIRSLIEAAREQTARAINSALVGMYWHIGKRIREEVLQNERAEYGREILSTLSKELLEEYGQGFSVPNLSRMMQFAERFPEGEIVVTLS